MTRLARSTYLILLAVTAVAIGPAFRWGDGKAVGAEKLADTAQHVSQDHAAARGSHDDSAHEDAKTPFAGTFINAVSTLIIFALLLIVLGKFAWGPLLAALQKREDFIQSSLDEAKNDRAEAEARLRELMDRLNRARAEASGIVEEGRRDAETVRRKLESQAHADADAMIARAKQEIQIASETALRELYETAAELATTTATRIIRKEITPADHQRLVQESIDQIRELNGNGTSQN